MGDRDLRKLKGIGPKALQKLADMGIASLEDLAGRSTEADYQGWAYFGKKDEWKRLVVQARCLLVPRYIEEKNIHFFDDHVKVFSKNELVAKMFITNVLELQENAVEMNFAPGSDFIELRAKKSGNLKNDEYYARLFTVGIVRAKDRLKGIKRHEAHAIDSEQGIAELQNIMQMQRQFDSYLEGLVNERLDETVEYGKTISVPTTIEYLKSISANLYFDSFLSLVQQYSLSDTPIVSHGNLKMSTGFNLALMGQPGTGKTFATVDLVLGNEGEGIPAHGLPGMNRYCGGMTVAQFVRIAQAYQGKRFNFIVTEFNDWFKYPGMVENLKQALERKWLKYETVSETIGPYKFDSFFSVNYNTQVHERGYEVTITDPNFNAIEDRMITRLHRMTKGRFVNILDSLKSHLLSETEFDPQRMRDHLTLVYAIQTEHPLVANQFEKKEIELEPRIVNAVSDTAKILVDMLPGEQVAFSPRLVKRTIQLASSMSLLKYFQGNELRSDDEMLRYALQFFCEEASVRARERVSSEAAFSEVRRKVLLETAIGL